jgi:hypothetical protein
MIPKSVKRLSAISRLKDLFGQPQHPYRPATQIFLDLNVDQLASDLKLAERGAERGAANRPDNSAETLDDIEHQVVERVEGHKQDAHSLYLEHLSVARFGGLYEDLGAYFHDHSGHDRISRGMGRHEHEYGRRSRNRKRAACALRADH